MWQANWHCSKFCLRCPLCPCRRDTHTPGEGGGPSSSSELGSGIFPLLTTSSLYETIRLIRVSEDFFKDFSQSDQFLFSLTWNREWVLQIHHLTPREGVFQRSPCFPGTLMDITCPLSRETCRPALCFCGTKALCEFVKKFNGDPRIPGVQTL